MIDEPLSRLLLASSLQPQRTERKRTGKANLRELLCAIVQQAIYDYRFCEVRGWIIGGIVIGHKATNKGWECRGRWTPAECAQLLAFFEDDGPCDRVLAMLGMDLDAARIRGALGMEREVHPIFRSVRAGGIAPPPDSIYHRPRQPRFLG